MLNEYEYEYEYGENAFQSMYSTVPCKNMQNIKLIHAAAFNHDMETKFFPFLTEKQMFKLMSENDEFIYSNLHVLLELSSLIIMGVKQFSYVYSDKWKTINFNTAFERATEEEATLWAIYSRMCLSSCSSLSYAFGRNNISMLITKEYAVGMRASFFSYNRQKNWH